MAKTAGKEKASPKGGLSSKGGFRKFEERLERLESLGERIRGNDIPLDEALAAFEEGIKLARGLEQELEKIESRIEILMNSAEAPTDESPDLELFDTGE